MHCRKGKPLAVGVRVLIPATISSVDGGADQPWCNITVKTDYPMGEGEPGEGANVFCLNARQVYRADALNKPDAKYRGEDVRQLKLI